VNYSGDYLKLLKDGTFKERVKSAKKHYTDCNLCPHECGIDRTNGVGFCQANDKAIVSSFGPHFGEERVLVGKRGSGTVFFGYCNMRCVFCQNYKISAYGEGNIVSNERLAEMFLQLQNHYRCHNINLVTPTHFVPNIIEAVYLAAQKGLYLPIVYNCGGYEKIETLRLLEGIVDIYMPDLKYGDETISSIYSGIKNYPKYAKQALREMDRQVSGLKTYDRNIAYRGLLIRHLVLPGNIESTKKVLDFIASELSPDSLVNIMQQYYPAYKAFEYDKINRRLSNSEYRIAYNYGVKLDLRLV
jgi:putative pyruvate formate lyase activating enzyme